MFGRYFTCLSLAVLLAVGEGQAATPVEVGTTVTIKNSVTAELEADRRDLDKGDKLHQNEIIETRRAAQAELRLNDETKLAMGPDARVVLDKFVYDADAAPGSVAVNMMKGAMRFITGTKPSSAYEIRTPLVWIGVRGTVFDTFVYEPTGETVLLLHNGAIEACTAPGVCRVLDRPGQMLRITPDRRMVVPARWDGSFARGTRVTEAFPFVEKPLTIDPEPRLQYAILLGRKPHKPKDPDYPRPPKDETGGKKPGSDTATVRKRRVITVEKKEYKQPLVLRTKPQTTIKTGPVFRTFPQQGGGVLR